MKSLFYTPPECPEHPGNHLESEFLVVNVPKGSPIGIPLVAYCPKTGKYLNEENKLVSAEEMAAEFVNKYYHKHYKISDIKVTTQRNYYTRSKD